MSSTMQAQTIASGIPQEYAEYLKNKESHLLPAVVWERSARAATVSMAKREIFDECITTEVSKQPDQPATLRKSI